MAYVEKQLLDTGITVPLIVNDNLNLGYFAPGSGVGEVDIYGIDSYPMRYDCGYIFGSMNFYGWLLIFDTGAHPTVWPTYRFPYNWQVLHKQESPTTPFAIAEFQGGSGEGWYG